MSGRHTSYLQESSVVKFVSFGTGRCSVMLRKCERGLWRVKQAGRQRGQMVGPAQTYKEKAPAERMNHHSTNCSSQHVQLTHPLCLCPDLKSTMMAEQHHGEVVRTEHHAASWLDVGGESVI